MTTFPSGTTWNRHPQLPASIPLPRSGQQQSVLQPENRQIRQKSESIPTDHATWHIFLLDKVLSTVQPLRRVNRFTPHLSGLIPTSAESTFVRANIDSVVNRVTM
jgi:hypothetical protein